MDNLRSLNILYVNGDLPVFPGWGGVEFLHVTGLARVANTVGLVSPVHTQEQFNKTETLSLAGVTLYLWLNPSLKEKNDGTPVHQPSLRWIGKTIYDLWSFLTFRPQDTGVRELQFCNLSGPLLQALKDEHWEVLIVVQSTCAKWLDYLPSFPVRVLVLHDVRALMYDRQAQVAPSVKDRFFYQWQSWIYRWYERNYCRKYDLVVTVSSTDEAWVRKNYNPERVVTIPIPVDPHYFVPDVEEKELPARIVFTGMMNHPPNIDAACFFAHEVFPIVHSLIPEAEFWIVGRDPSSEIKSLANLRHVFVTGFVEDIRPYLAEATAIVVPLRFGSGMRQKILEAWAMQKCVVATQIGAEGLDWEDGVNILIGDDVQTIASRIVQAIKDPNLRKSVGKQGRDLILKNHDPACLSRRYHQTLNWVFHEKRIQNHSAHFLIDLRWMYPGIAGGIENLSRSFLNCLKGIDHSNFYTVVVPAEVKFDFDFRSNNNFKISVIDGPGYFLKQIYRRITKKFFGNLGISSWLSQEVETLAHLKKLSVDVALSIPGYIHSDLQGLANVLIVPDIQHEYFPQFFSFNELNERRKIYTESIMRARHLCAISEFTKNTLIERLNIPQDRITTTYLAADPRFHPENREANNGNASHVLNKYGLTRGDYLFYPANTWPHKNHKTLFKALYILKEEHHLAPLLVCTGSPKNAHDDLLQLIEKFELRSRIKFLGYIPPFDLPALYEGAAALTFPSLFEGFGIPLLEAMWCSCPIVCSNTTSLPEIVGDAGVLVDPSCPEDLASGIGQVLTNQETRRVLLKRGSERVKDFSWPNFTVKILDVFHSVREKKWG